MRGTWTALAVALNACAVGPRRGAGDQPLAVRLEPVADSTRLVLIAAPGWKVNARLKPALETPDHGVFRFDAVGLTPDSAYFTDAPTAIVPYRAQAVRGGVRASVCAPGERLCRAVMLAVGSEK